MTTVNPIKLNSIYTPPVSTPEPSPIEACVEKPFKQIKLTLEAEPQPLPKASAFQKDKVLIFLRRIDGQTHYHTNWHNGGRERFKEFYQTLEKNGIFDESKFIQLLQELIQPFTFNIGKYVIELDIQNKEVLFDWVKLAASKGAYWGSQLEQCNFNLEQRYEIATIIVQLRNADSVFNYRREFNLTLEQYFEIAKIAAQYDTTPYFKRFQFSEAQNFELIKLAAQANAVEFTRYLPDGLTNAQNFEIATIIAQKNGWEISKCIAHFKLDQEQRFEIAKIAAVTSDQGVSVHLPNYQLTLEQQYMLGNIVVDMYPEWVLVCISNYPPEYHRHFIKIAMRKVFRKFQYKSSLVAFPTLNIALKNIKLSNKFDIQLQMKSPELKEKAQYALSALIVQAKAHDNLPFLEELLSKYPKLLTTIFEEREPDLYVPIIESLLELNKIPEEITNERRLIAALPLLTMDIPDKDQLVAKLLRYDVRDRQLRNPLILAFDKLKIDSNLANRSSIVHWILQGNKNEVIYRSRLIKAIYDLKGKDLLSTTSDYESILTKKLAEALPDVKIDTRKMLSTFFSMRNPMAIFTYAAGVATLNTANLTDFINSVLDGTFKETRQDTQKNPHLLRLQQKHPQILQQFHQGFKLQIALEDSTITEAPHITIRQIIKNILNDGHMQDIKLQSHLQALAREGVTVEDVAICYETFKKVVPENSQILADILAMNALFQKNKTEDIWILNDTDDPEDLLLCGTDVQGSCQRVDASPTYNRGLLGYLLNGQTRLITLKDTDSKFIKGRAIIRLLLDENENPVLQIERIYPYTLDAQLKKAIEDFAKKRAEMLHIPLVSKEIYGRIPFGKTVYNHGVRAPEYIDSACGIHETYSIKELEISYDAP